MKLLTTTVFVLLAISSYAQKKILDHADFDIWNTIQNRAISANGNFIMYSLEKGEEDNTLKIKDPKATLIFEYARGQNGRFTFDSEFALYTIKAWQDSVREMKRRKVKKDKLPKDTLGIFNLKDKSLTKIPNIKSYKIPEEWAGFVAYQLEKISAEKKKEEGKKNEEGGEKKETKKKGKTKKVSKENGYHLIVRNLATAQQDTFKYVTNYIFAKEGKRLTFVSTGADSTFKAGVYLLNLENNSLQPLHTVEKGKYPQLAISESGKNVGFIADMDTTKIQIRPNELYHWQEGASSSEKLVDENSAPKGYLVSANGHISFSQDESKMFFGLATPPIVKDTTLLDEEIVNVEVWTYDEPRLYTVQELQVENDKKRSYLTAINLNHKNKLIQLASIEYPNASLGNEGNAEYAMVSTSLPYQIAMQWQGGSASDYALVNTNSGEVSRALTKMWSRAKMSPGGGYIFGYDLVDSTWFTYTIASNKFTKLTKGKVFFNELNDAPNYPFPYGSAGWTENDAELLVYDRYDIWQFKPGSANGTRLNQGA